MKSTTPVKTIYNTAMKKFSSLSLVCNTCQVNTNKVGSSVPIKDIDNAIHGWVEFLWELEGNENKVYVYRNDDERCEHELWFTLEN